MTTDPQRRPCGALSYATVLVVLACRGIASAAEPVVDYPLAPSTAPSERDDDAADPESDEGLDGDRSRDLGDGTPPLATEPAKTVKRPGSGPGDAPLGVSASWSPAANVRGGGDFSMNVQSANVGFPVSVVEDHGAWIAIAKLSRVEIATTATLPQSGLAIPTELWSVQAGALHVRDLGDGWTAGGMLMAGSAGDANFEDERDLTLTTAAFLTVPSRERDAWKFSLFYSPTSQLPYPLPGIAYEWRPDDVWDVSIGVPASIAYRPNEKFTLQAAWRPLTQFDVTATQRLGRGWALSGGYASKTETFWLSERRNDDDRLFLFDQRLFVALGRDLFDGVRLEFSGAYLFDRRVFLAENFTGSRDDGFGIEPGFLGTVQLSFVR